MDSYSLESTNSNTILSNSSIEYDEKQMNEQIIQLTYEKNEIQKRFDDLCAVFNKMDDNLKENNSLKAIIRQKEQEIEDIQYRLSISIKATKELEKEIEYQKERNEKICSEIVTQNSTKSNKEQNLMKQISDLNEELQNSQYLNNDLTIANKRLIVEIESFLSDCCNKLNMKNLTLKDVANLIGEKPETKKEEIIVEDKTKIILLAKKFKKLKSELNNIKESNFAKEEEIKNKDKSIFELNLTVEGLKRDVYSYRETIQKTNDENNKLKSLNFEMENQINSLNETIDKMKRYKEDIPMKQPEPIIKTIVEVKKDEETERNLQQKIEELQKSIKKEQNNNKNLLNANNESKNENERLQSKLNELQTKNKLLISLNEELKRTNDNLRTSLIQKTEPQHYSRSYESDINESNYNMLRSKCTEQLYEIGKLKNEIREGKEEIEKQKNTINELNKSLNQKEEENKELKKDITDANALKCSKENENEAKEDLIDEKTFADIDFDESIGNELKQIICNPFLQPATKVKSIIKKIATYAENDHNEGVNALLQAKREINLLKNKVNSFIIDASLAVFNEPITCDDIGTEKSDNFIAFLRSVKPNLLMLSDKSEILNNIRKSAIMYGYDGKEDIADWFSSLKNEISILSLELKKYKKYFSKSAKRCSILTKEIEENKKAMETEHQEYINAIQDLEERNTNLNNEILNNKFAIERSAEELELTKNHFEKLQKQMESTHKNEVEQLERNINENTAKSQIEVDKIKKDLEESIAQRIENEQIIEKLRLQLKSEIMTSKNLKDDQETSKKIAKDAMNEFAKKLEREKEIMREGYEDAIQELKNNLEQSRNDISALVEVQNELQADIEDTRNELSKVTYEKNRSNALVAALKGQIQKQEEISEIALKSATLSAKAKANDEINKERSAFEIQRKEIISTVLKTFSKFADVNEKIDERSMKNVLQKASETILKHEKTDSSLRKLLKISERQSIEDAVAQLFI